MGYELRHGLLVTVIFATLLKCILAQKTMNCTAVVGPEQNLTASPAEIKIEQFCNTADSGKKVENDCGMVLVDGEQVAADEVRYVADRDRDHYIGCRNSKWLKVDKVYDKVCRLNNVYQCDNESQCATDECDCGDKTPTDSHLFYCPNTTINGVDTRGGCITKDFLCNGWNHCPDGHDESLCYQSFTCVLPDDAGNVQYVPNFKVCDGYYHCDDFSDEAPETCRNYKIAVKPTRKYERCVKKDTNTVTKLKITKVCDDNPECDRKCHNYTLPLDTPDNCWAWSDEEDCRYQCKGSEKKIPLSWVCDTYPQCPFGDDECSDACNYAKYWNSTLPGSLTGLNGSDPDIRKRNGSDYYDKTPAYCASFNQDACTTESKPFLCADGKTCVPQIGVCNTINNCGDWSDEMNCTGRFYCENKNPLYVPWENVCNGATDCLDGSDECQKCNFDILASDESLIANYILACLVWVMGIIALLGNLILILSKSYELKNAGRKMNSVTKISTLLLVNLAMSDFLMGIYLIGIASMERKLHGPSYCIESKSWRSSFSCKFFGSLCLLSSECSIFMMTLITLHRLISVIIPSKVASLGKKGLMSWYIAIIVVWIIVIFLALIPSMHAFQEFFVTGAYYRDNRFFGKGDKKSLTDYVSRYYGTPMKEGDELPTWDYLFEQIEKTGHGQYFKPTGLMGFYSNHGVCLHKLFTTLATKSWPYSLALNVFNSICFIFIVVAYSHILAVSKKMTSGKSKGSSRMSRKIQRLVFTDAMCWIPTCICAYINISGVRLSDDVYAYTAILILPINSCLNPIVYTDIIDKVHVWILKYVLKQGSDQYNSTGHSQGHDKVGGHPKDQLTNINTTFQMTAIGSPGGIVAVNPSSIAKLSPSPYRHNSTA